ncbi:hypothetical protein [Arcobacter sp. YIC-310]|uniref:hypothetical protein n=1 Tax=Arcobacter sp. YIC-310 TaxID=3376632 RepID=UPI003C177FC5
MNYEDFKKFTINIDYKYDVPIKPKNPYLSYTKKEDRKGKTLYVEVFYDGKKIGRGVILDFYKKFEIRTSDWGNLYTFPLNNTNIGNKIHKIKFYTSPKIPKSLRKTYINSFAERFEKNLNSLIRKAERKEKELFITYIPSSTKTSNLLAKQLSEDYDITLKKLIKKDSELGDSKSIQDYFESMEFSQKKYKYNSKFITENKDGMYLIVDDVMGLGCSMLTTLKKFYDITNKINYFFIVAKDVKR